MKSARILLKYTSTLFCIFLLFSFSPDHGGTDDTDDDKNKKEKIKELSYDKIFFSNSIDFEFEAQPKVKIYNANDILVYEDNVASIEDIQQKSLKKLFFKM